MKKDIQIPKVTDVEIVLVYEYNEIYKTNDWNAYIINHKAIPIEMVVIVSKGFTDSKSTSTMRKKLDVLPANSFAKIELVQPELFQLNNQYQVSFFAENTLFDKTVVFKKNTVTESALRFIKMLDKKGILGK